MAMSLIASFTDAVMGATWEVSSRTSGLGARIEPLPRGQVRRPDPCQEIGSEPDELRLQPRRAGHVHGALLEAHGDPRTRLSQGRQLDEASEEQVALLEQLAVGIVEGLRTEAGGQT